MGYTEYLGAREFLVMVGQPVITYILINVIISGIFSILYLFRKDSKYFDLLVKCLYISTGLYSLDFHPGMVPHTDIQYGFDRVSRSIEADDTG